jgi:hypothetical protein
MRKTIQQRYEAIRSECAIVTACDAKHAPYLFNAIASFDRHFPDRPPIIVYDIGMTALQKMELRRTPGVEIRPVEKFVAHWRVNWSWKMYVLTNYAGRYVLYLDLPNFVVLRSLASWFVSIEKNEYLVIFNDQVLGDITPSDYWVKHGLDTAAMQSARTFGAGIIGFDRHSRAFEAIQRAFERTKEGLNLGRSATEKNKNYQPDVIRQCPCFRADQTLLNLAFRETYGSSLNIRRTMPYCGNGGASDHQRQYLWYARRKKACMVYLNQRPSSLTLPYVLNRSYWAIKLSSISMAKLALGRK